MKNWRKKNKLKFSILKTFQLDFLFWTINKSISVIISGSQGVAEFFVIIWLTKLL